MGIDVNLYEAVCKQADINQNNTLQVLISPALLDRWRQGADKKLLELLKDIEPHSVEPREPTDYPMPPSPISCPPSDGSDKGKE